jgi:hypothetical protein
LVGKGPGSEPFIDIDTMLNLTASAKAGSARPEGVDLPLSDPHIMVSLVLSHWDLDDLHRLQWFDEKDEGSLRGGDRYTSPTEIIRIRQTGGCRD